MHELALARAVLDTAVMHANGRRVRSVDVTVGALRQVVAGSLAFHFEILARGTPCDGARLRQRTTPARLLCSCGYEWELEEPSFRCPRCASARARVISGEELVVDSIEIEEEPCTAPR
jgi:hydrogenase nickel incorporation protein HypA/HybF